MMPEPAPPVPVLAPVARPPATAQPEPNRRPEPKRAFSATTVATLDIPVSVPGEKAAPTGQDRAEIERVAGLYRANPGTVRVIGYAAAPAAGVGRDPLGSYHAALDRAQAVARALAVAGIPANKIQTEAAPTAGARALGRVEIQLAQ
jgi:outer membrane protein OmpA-like peptidoglycan-associated protein